MQNLIKKIAKLQRFSFINLLYNSSSRIIFVIIILLLILGCFFVFLTPEEYIQGHTAKIMYIHIPSAWLTLLMYFLSSISILIYFLYKNMFYAFLSYSISMTGLIFNFLCIMTGMIWGKLTWGVWWAWDIRLTTVFILMIFYLCFIYLFNICKNKKNFMFAGIINLIGAINIPIIKLSVNFFNSLHQKSSFIRSGGISISSEFLRPLWFFLIIFILSGFILTVLILKIELFNLKKKRFEV